jgi:tRNA pseudouridine55 synthase
MDRPYLIDKPLGATPLQALQVFRNARSIPESVKLAYAGRLDPLASGLLPVLSGGQLSRQEEYWYLSKRYTVAVLLGISTDSYDLLGMPRIVNPEAPSRNRITASVRGLVGKTDLSVPIYSSHRLEGRPLFAWARASDDGPSVVPVRRMSVSQVDITGIAETDATALLAITVGRVGLVDGDFRQDAIRDAWQALLVSGQFFTVIGLDIHCSSGTYVRSLANELGRRLGTGAVVVELRRTRVGPWTIDDPDVVRLAWPRRSS